MLHYCDRLAVWMLCDVVLFGSGTRNGGLSRQFGFCALVFLLNTCAFSYYTRQACDEPLSHPLSKVLVLHRFVYAPVAVQNGNGILLTYLSTTNAARMKLLFMEIEKGSGEVATPFSYVAVNFSLVNDTHNIAPPPIYWEAVLKHIRKRSQFIHLDLLAKTMFAMNYFLNETEFSWMWRGTDDVIINFAKLDNFTSMLESKYDPNRDAVVLGHCISRALHKKDRKPNQQTSWIQGGSGFVMSRAAALRMAPLTEWLLELDATNDLEEDVAIPFLMEHVGISLYNSSCCSFVGHDFRLIERSRAVKGQLGTLTSCPETQRELEEMTSVDKRDCRRILCQASDVVFFHSRQRGFSRVRRLAYEFFSVPKSVHFYTVHEGQMRLCELRRNQKTTA